MRRISSRSRSSFAPSAKAASKAMVRTACCCEEVMSVLAYRGHARSHDARPLVVRPQAPRAHSLAHLRTLDRDGCADMLAVLAPQALACILGIRAPADVFCDVLQLRNDESVAAIADDVNRAAALGQERKRPRRGRMLRWHR